MTDIKLFVKVSSLYVTGDKPQLFFITDDFISAVFPRIFKFKSGLSERAGKDGFLLFVCITTRLLNDRGAILCVQFLCFHREKSATCIKARCNTSIGRIKITLTWSLKTYN